MQGEGLEIKEAWNKKRIIIALAAIAILVLGAFFLKNFVLGKGLDFFKKSPIVNKLTKVVEGTSINDVSNSGNPTTQSSSPLGGVQKVIQERLNTIKEEITKINVVDIASSSPQFQKIIQDLQSLQQYPHNELKDVCRKVCGGL